MCRFLLSEKRHEAGCHEVFFQKELYKAYIYNSMAFSSDKNVTFLTCAKSTRLDFKLSRMFVGHLGYFEPSLASLWNVNSGNLGTDDVHWRRFGRHLGHAKWKLKESLTCKSVRILRNHINIHTWSIREQKRQKILQFCGSILRHQPTNPFKLEDWAWCRTPKRGSNSQRWRQLRR